MHGSTKYRNTFHTIKLLNRSLQSRFHSVVSGENFSPGSAQGISYINDSRLNKVL